MVQQFIHLLQVRKSAQFARKLEEFISEEIKETSEIFNNNLSSNNVQRVANNFQTSEGSYYFNKFIFCRNFEILASQYYKKYRQVFFLKMRFACHRNMNIIDLDEIF